MVSSATALSGLSAQHRFDMAEKDRELAVALGELAEARLELPRRDRMKAFALAPSPGAMMSF